MDKRTKKAWEMTQEKTGTDILSIVMDMGSKRVSTSDTMDKISEHCIAFHESMIAIEVIKCQILGCNEAAVIVCEDKGIGYCDRHWERIHGKKLEHIVDKALNSSDELIKITKELDGENVN